MSLRQQQLYYMSKLSYPAQLKKLQMLTILFRLLHTTVAIITTTTSTITIDLADFAHCQPFICLDVLIKLNLFMMILN